MIPSRTVWAVGLCMLGTLLLPGRVAHAAPAEPGPLAEQGQSFGVLRHQVTLPDAANVERGCFVAAHDESLRAALRAWGIFERRWPCESKQASCTSHLGLSPVVFARDANIEQGSEALQLTLWRLSRAEDGQSVWWAEAVSQPSLPACGVRRPEVEVWPLFADGTARITRARPLVPVRKQDASGSAAERPSPVVVDLRHASVELKLAAADAAPPVEAPVCSHHGALPAPSAISSERSAIWHVPTHRKRLALTFDACSTYEVGRFNPAVIAALKQHQIPATLFIGGHWAEMFPDELEALASEPLFELGNHTYSHPHMRDLPPSLQAQELLWTQQLIYSRTGKLPRFFRPPYGEVDDEMLGEVAKAGLVTVEYDLPAGDADVHVSAARLSHWVEGQISPGSVVIMHMNRPGNHTAEALAEIATELRGRGYTFCRMSSLVDDSEEGCK